ncbi:MAG: MFS transporter [Rickettsia endosymbiont of Bryobia graminum]|nr:MFS transporter [Rickettsia endosymbiont of Bryobia graminum]
MTRPAFLIAFFTTIIRYYDYALFGLSAAILSKNFLPPSNNNNQLLLFYAIYVVAVIARPIGSIIFGFIGDKYGRAISVKISIFLATGSTILIGLIPDFNKIGILATCILTFCHMVFLVSLSGDIDGIKIYAVEKIGKFHKNYINGVIVFCTQIGALFAATMYHFSTKFPDINYLWRLNFIIGGVLGISIILMRHLFQESEEFLQYKRDNKSYEVKFLDLTTILKNTFGKFIIVLIISGCIGGIYHFLAIFWGVFAAKAAVIMDSSQAQILNIWIIVLYGIMSIFSGILADKFNSKKQIYISLIFSIIAVSVVYFLLHNNEEIVYYFPLIIISMMPFYSVPLQIIVQSIFATNIRARMYSLAHSLGGMLISSMTPFFSMSLWKYTGSIYLVLGVLGILLLLLLIAVIFLYNNASFTKANV